MEQIFTVGELQLNYIKREQPITLREFSMNSVVDTLKNHFFHDINYRERVVMIAFKGAKIFYAAEIAAGGLTYAACDVRIIMQYAIMSTCNSIIIAHNHPSGTAKASKEDIRLMESLQSACSLLEINLTDFIIITDTEAYSVLHDQTIN